jgi:hypothetical protein
MQPLMRKVEKLRLPSLRCVSVIIIKSYACTYRHILLVLRVRQVSERPVEVGCVDVAKGVHLLKLTEDVESRRGPRLMCRGWP